MLLNVVKLNEEALLLLFNYCMDVLSFVFDFAHVHSHPFT